MIFFYHLLSTLAALLLVLLYPLTTLFSKYKWKGLPHHFGWVPANSRRKGKTLWLHALSMGEVVAAAPVLKELHEKNPEVYIVLSVTTDSGYAAALKLNSVDSVFFHPLDCLPFSQLALIRINPDLFIFTDTGFWPGMIDLLYKSHCPILLFNGRLSERSARRYLRAGLIFKPTFKKLHRLCMQNTRGEKAVMLLGADPERVEVVGDLKFDALQPMTVEEKKYLRKTYKLHEETPVWIAGSTHAGEEEIILKAHEQLIAKHPNLVLILAPRRVERVKEVSALLQRKNISFVRRSLLKHKESPSVILLDTMGELTRVYALGQIAFVGRSLVKPGGGHSLIEPLSYGLAVLHGPFVENILHVSETVDSKGLASGQ